MVVCSRYNCGAFDLRAADLFGEPAVKRVAFTARRCQFAVCGVKSDFLACGIRNRAAVGIKGDGVAVGLPVRVQVRPAVDGLVGDVHGLAFAAPERERVALAGRGGRVCGGQIRANAGLGGTEDALRLGVVVLICRQRFQRIEVNDRNQLGDDELEILPVSGDQQLLQSGGFILQTFQIPHVAVEHAVVVPAAVDLEVEIEIAARIDLRKVNRIASKLIGGIRNIHDRRAQIAGLEDHEVDVGLFGLPLCVQSMVGRRGDSGVRRDLIAILRSSEPAQEVIAGAGRDRQLAIGFVERDGLARRIYVTAVRVEGDGIGVQRPLCRQGDIGGDGRGEIILRFFVGQIPVREDIAVAGGGNGGERRAAVFNVHRLDFAAAIGVKGHDPVVRDRADIVCTQLDGVGRPDVVRNVVADLLVGLVRRVQFPLNRFLRQQLVCARCVREVLVIAGLCAGVNVSVDFERCNVAAGNGLSIAVRLLFNRHNVRRGIDERYGDAIVADACFSVHAGDMDAVGLAAGRDLGNLAPVGRGMGELDQIVNAGFYRLGFPLIVFPADVPAQRVLGVQVVRRILLERLHKVCDREGHDPCGIILAFYKRIVLPGNTCLCSILPLTAVHVVVAVLPEAVDAGDGNKAVQCVKDVVAGRRFNHLAGDFNDRQFTLLPPLLPPFADLVTSCFGVIAEGDGQRCVLLVNEPVLGAGGGVICRQIRRYRDRRGDVVALIVHLHIADRILRRGGNIIRHVSMCCFVVLADDSKTAVQRRGLLGGSFALDIEGWNAVLLPDAPACFLVLREVPEFEGANVRGVIRFRVALIQNVERVDKRRDGLCNCAFDVIAVLAVIFALRYIPDRIGVAKKRSCIGVLAVVVLHNRHRLHTLDLDSRVIHVIVTCAGLVGLVGGSRLFVLNLDHRSAVVQYPLAILVADYKRQRCLVRIVELMRLRFFAVVLCDIRRGLDGHVVFPRLIQSRRFRPVERLALRVVDQVVVFRPAAGRADVLYLNLPDSRFHIRIGGSRNKRGLRIFCFPDRVELGGRGGCCNRIARLDGGLRCARIPSPAEEVVAVSDRDVAGNWECHRAGVALQRHRVGAWHVGDGIRRVLVVVQGVGDFGVRQILAAADSNSRTNAAGRVKGHTKGDVARSGAHILIRNPSIRLPRLFVVADFNVNVQLPAVFVVANEVAPCRTTGVVGTHIRFFDILRYRNRILCVFSCASVFEWCAITGDSQVKRHTIGRQRRHRQHAEHHNQNQQKSNESLFHSFGSPPFYCLFRVVETDLC